MARGQPELPARSTRRRRVADPESVFHHYRKLIALRHNEPAVVDGDFTMLLPDDERLYAFTRALGDDRPARARQLHRRRRDAPRCGRNRLEEAELLLGNWPPILGATG